MAEQLVGIAGVLDNSNQVVLWHCADDRPHEDEVAEWLRRWTANPMCSARVGSNPILVDIFGQPFFDWKVKRTNPHFKNSFTTNCRA